MVICAANPVLIIPWCDNCEGERMTQVDHHPHFYCPKCGSSITLEAISQRDHIEREGGGKG